MGSDRPHRINSIRTFSSKNTTHERLSRCMMWALCIPCDVPIRLDPNRLAAVEHFSSGNPRQSFMDKSNTVSST